MMNKVKEKKMSTNKKPTSLSLTTEDKIKATKHIQAFLNRRGSTGDNTINDEALSIFHRALTPVASNEEIRDGFNLFRKLFYPIGTSFAESIGEEKEVVDEK